MTDVHPFMPITNYENFAAALNYIAERSMALANYVLGAEIIRQQNVTLDTLTVYAQSQAEYNFILSEITTGKYGLESTYSHEPTTYISSNLAVGDANIFYLGVRKFNENQRHIGYGDFKVDDYKYVAGLKKQGVDPIVTGLGQNMLSIMSPNYDVLGYLVASTDHDDYVARGSLVRL